MFSLKIDDVRLINNAIGIISEFITEATFSVSKDGLRLVAMDPANISMVILDILPSSFTKYDVSTPETITVNLEPLKHALRRVRAGELVSMSTDKNKFIVEIAGISKRRFAIPLIEKEEKERSIPNLDFKATAEIDAKEFKEYIEDAGSIGDAINIAISSSKLSLSAGEIGSKVDIELSKGSDALIKLDAKETSRSIYSVEYLKKMAKSAAIADTALIQFSSDYPLKLDFKALNKLKMSFILAPRIENK